MAFRDRSFGHGNRFAGIGRAHPDPAGEVGNDGFGEGLLGRHLEIVLVAQGVEEEALLRFTRHDGTARFAAFPQSGRGVEEQFSPDFFRADRVAFVALRDEDGTDLFLEKLALFRCHALAPV